LGGGWAWVCRAKLNVLFWVGLCKGKQLFEFCEALAFFCSFVVGRVGLLG